MVSVWRMTASESDHGQVGLLSVKIVNLIDYKGKNVYHTDLLEKALYFHGEKLIGVDKSNAIIALGPKGKLLWKQAPDQEGFFSQATSNAFFALSEDRQNIAFYATGTVKSPADYKVVKKIPVVKQKAAEPKKEVADEVEEF